MKKILLLLIVLLNYIICESQPYELKIFKYGSRELISCNKSCKKDCWVIIEEERVYNLSKQNDTLSLKFNLKNYGGFGRLKIEAHYDTLFFFIEAFKNGGWCGDEETNHMIECKFHYPRKLKPSVFMVSPNFNRRKKSLQLYEEWVDCF